MNRPVVTAAPFATFAAPAAAAGATRVGLASYVGTGAIWLLVGFLAISTFEGALRFYAASAGVPWVVYAKDVLLVGALALGTIATCATDVRNLPFLVVAALLGIGTVVGIAMLPEIRQPLFAAKTWLPLLCGTVVAQAAGAHRKLVLRTCVALWVAAVGGVILTVAWRAPWVGFSYEIGGVSVEGSREWTIGDANRAAGFSRASFDAALQCLFFACVIAAFARRYVVGLAVWLVTAGAVYLTLSRSALVAVAVGMGLHAAVSLGRPTQRLAKAGILALAIAVAALPFAAGEYYRNKATVIDMSTVASTSSFEERATKTWPHGLALVNHRGNWVVGRGIGGIGIAQQFYETDQFNPGDNFFIYLWGALGLVGMVLLALLPFQVWRAPLPLGSRSRAGFVIVGTFLAVGLTLNAIEAAVASVFLGLALPWLTAGSRAENDTR